MSVLLVIGVSVLGVMGLLNELRKLRERCMTYQEYRDV